MVQTESIEHPASAPAVTASSKLRHDLLTPVNHLIGYSEMLLEEMEDRGEVAVIERVQAIRSAAKDVYFYIQQFLPSGGESTGDQFDALATLLAGPAGAIGERIADLRRDASESLRTEIEPDLEHIEAAIAQLQTLLGEAPAAAAQTIRQKESGAGGVQIAAPDRPTAAPAVVPIGVALKPASGKILVVDDNQGNRELLCRRLQREGYTVSEAQGGQETLDTLAGAAFDLVLLDVMMPDIDGFEVLSRMKADPALSGVSVIMISAMDEVQGAVHCIELGAEDFITKPFDPVLLRARIGASLDKKRLRDDEKRSSQQLRNALKAVEEEKQEWRRGGDSNPR